MENEIIKNQNIEQFNHFANDETDEIKVKVWEKTIWLLKSWANPEILDISNIKSHSELTTQINKNLILIWIYDKKLQEFFKKQLNSVKKDSIEYIWLLFSQTELAFKFLSVFYSIESIVDNMSLAKKSKLENIKKWWEIDLIAIMLPKILSSNLKNCKSHSDISVEIKNMKEEFNKEPESIEWKKFILLSLISRKLGFSFKEIMFAWNILSIINGNDWFDEVLLDSGIKILKDTYRNTNLEWNSDSVLADKNSEIRFKNWNFAIESEENFLWKNMNYDSVCLPSKNLFELISNNQNLIRIEHQGMFKESISQLKNVDATSALWRFLIWMFNENMFTQELYNVINSTKNEVNDIIGKLKLDNFIQNPSNNIDIKQSWWKFIWIHLAREILSWKDIKIPNTNVIPCPWVSEWLNNIPNLSDLISKLDNDENIDIIIQNIFERIDNLAIPDDLLFKIKQGLDNSSNWIILRSSALIEDVEDIWPAPWVFDSFKVEKEEEIEIAFKNVVKSFFNKKAIMFRNLKWLSNEPLIAILLQPFIKWRNWTIFIDSKNIHIDITWFNVNDLDNKDVSSFNLKNNNKESIVEEKIKKLVNIAKRIFKIFWNLDIEFVIDSEDNINILQVRMLDHNNINVDIPILEINSKISVDLVEIKSIKDFWKIQNLENKKFNIIISEEIDVAKFQNEILEKIIMLSKNINSVTIQKKIAHTSHFSNIIRTLWINLIMNE